MFARTKYLVISVVVALVRIRATGCTTGSDLAEPSGAQPTYQPHCGSAEENSEQGMIAFTRYCVDLMTHSKDTNDTDNEYSNQNCGVAGSSLARERMTADTTGGVI